MKEKRERKITTDLIDTTILRLDKKRCNFYKNARTNGNDIKECSENYDFQLKSTEERYKVEPKDFIPL